MILRGLAHQAKAWWHGRLGRLGRIERTVLIAGITVRLAGVTMLAYTIPLVWGQFTQPAVAVLVAAGLAVTAAVVVALWLGERSVHSRTLLIDLPVGAAALFINAEITQAPHPGWAFFVYPYTLLIGFTLGLACRRLTTAALCGLVWAGVHGVARTVVHGSALPDVLAAVPSYLADPLLGCLAARLMRRTAGQLERARDASAIAITDLATAQERTRYARALHDRILQTVEAIAASDLIDDGAFRDRIAERAAWLRRFVETGRVDNTPDLIAELESAAAAARRAGLQVAVNDAALRMPDPPAEPSGPRRAALVEATSRVLVALVGSGSVVLRAAPERTGVLITILAEGPGGSLSGADLHAAGEKLAAFGGTLSLELEPGPYLELWIPSGAAGPVPE